MTGELQLSLLGKLQISRDGTPVTGFVSTKAQALLCYLAVTARPHDRQALAALLWGEMPEVEARTNLRTVLANLRKLVEPHLLISREAVSFNRSNPYWLDVELFQAALAAAGILDKKQSPEISLPNPQAETEFFLPPLRQAVEVYQGDFLEGFAVREALEFEEWMLSQRERLRQLAVQALHSLAKAHTARGEYAAGIDYTSRLLALEPWQEEGHRQMMLLLARSGQRSAALAQYETCRQILAEELGVEPTTETTVLYERLKAADAPRPHNLPPQATPFIGRKTERAQLATYLDQLTCRLLTLVGPGGIGKTRLALQAAAENLPLFQDGIFFVPLAAVSSREAIISSILSTLNLSLSGPLEPKAQLLNYLRSKELLLILDNFDHLLSSVFKEDKGGTGLLVDILQAAPRVKLLVTSRERLNLQEEWLFEVEGLAFPEEQLAPKEASLPSSSMREGANFLPSGEGGADREVDLERYSAVTLFVQQAQRVQADFTLSDGNQADVIRLCRLLQGMPLGLELAAMWLPVLSCGEIVAEIERDLDFLATSLRNVPDRHRSMRAVFESSWHLLSEAEREVLKRLSVFRGGFQRAAAMEVTGASLALLLGLLNKSLLRRDASGRYDMHELIRQYAAEKLAQSPAEQAEMEARHCAYYAEFMQQRDKLLRSPRQLETMREIAAELENIQTAWQYAVERGNSLDKFTWSLWFFYTMEGGYYEGMQVFAGVIERLEARHSFDLASADAEQSRIYAGLLAQQADFYYSLTRFEPAKALLRQALSLLTTLNAPRELGLALQTLGLIACYEGEYPEAKQYLEQSMPLARTVGDEWIALTSTSMLGSIAYVLGEYTQAEKLLRQSLAALREVDQMWGSMMTLTLLSSVLSTLGRYTEARQLLQEGLTTSREMGDRWGIASCLNRLGAVLNQMGEAERLEAKRLQQESLALFQEIGDDWGLANALNQLGQISCALGEYNEAYQHLHEALRLARRSQIKPTVLKVLVSLAELWLQTEPDKPASTGRNVNVLELLALVLSHPASEQATKDRAVHLLAKLEADLPHSTIETAWEQGKAKTLEAVAAEIMAQASSAQP